MLAAPSDAVCISEEAAGSLVDVVLKRAAVARFLKTAAQSNMYAVKIAEPRSFRDALLKNSKSVPCPDSLILDLCVADDLPVDAIMRTYFKCPDPVVPTTTEDEAHPISPVAMPPTAEHVFFKLSVKSPALIRSGSSDNGLDISTDDIVCQRLKVYHRERRDGEMKVFVHYGNAADSSDCYSDHFVLSSDCLMENTQFLTQWQAGEEEEFSVTGFEYTDKAAVSRIISRMMAADAVEAGIGIAGTLDVPHDDDMLPHLSAMQNDCLVKKISHLTDYSCWVICHETMDI